MDTFHELGVREAAQAIRAGDLTAEALAETLLARCSAAAQLNAFISLEPDRVRAAARRADQQRQRGDRWVRSTACRSCSRTISTRPIFRRLPERPASRRIVQSATRRSSSGRSMPAPSCEAKLICKSWRMARPATTQRLVRCTTLTIPRASQAARAAVLRARSPRGSRLPASAPIPPARCASPGRFAASPAFVRAPCAGRRPASYRSRIPATLQGPWRATSLIACFSTASSRPARARSRRPISKACASACPAAISGKISMPRSGKFSKPCLRLRDAGVALVEGDVADRRLDAAAGFPIAL